MKNREIQEINKIQLIGEIIDIKDKYIIQVNEAIFEAKKAVSCLIKPEIGDKVLFFKDNESYILAILQRKGDIEIEEENLKITVKKLDLQTKDLNIASKNSEIVIENINLISSFVEIKTNVFKHLSNSIEKISKIFKQTNEIFISKSKKRDITTKTNKTTSKVDIKYSDNIVINAKKEIKLDADIVNVG